MDPHPQMIVTHVSETARRARRQRRRGGSRGGETGRASEAAARSYWAGAAEGGRRALQRICGESTSTASTSVV